MEVSFVESQSWEEMAQAESFIPEFERSHSAQSFQSRLEGRPHLALLARDGDRLIGYKIGYAETAERFYSWVGGVHPDYRGQGSQERCYADKKNGVEAAAIPVSA